MNTQRMLDTFFEMVTIDSPSGHEAGMAAYCVRKLESLGFEVRYDDSQPATGSDTPQIIATLPAAGAGRIALSAHMDCVEPCSGIKPRIEDGVVYSDGTTILSADDKAGIAQIFEAVESAIESGIAYPEVTVLLSVCEEQGAAGAPHFPEVLFDPPVLTLVMDADGPAGTIVLTAPYHYTFTAAFSGRAAHAGVEPEAGINAIAMAADAVCRMELGRLDESTTASVGVIQGGKATNIVADECVLRGECRSFDGERALGLRDQMSEAMEQAAAAAGGSVSVDWVLSYPGIDVPRDDADVQMLVSACREVGIEPVLASTGGGSDANQLWPKGCRAIPLGTGMTNFHSVDEHVAISDMENSARLLERILEVVGKGEAADMR